MPAFSQEKKAKVHRRQLRLTTPEVIEATAKYCGAVTVSGYPPYRETTEAIELLRSAQVTTNIHFILTSKTVDTAIEWLNDPPTFLNRANAIVFLNYKPVGQFADEKLLLNKSPRVEEFFKLATSGRRNFRIGFDTCTITGLARFGNAPAISAEGCDAGRFSLLSQRRWRSIPVLSWWRRATAEFPLSRDALIARRHVNAFLDVRCFLK